MRTINIHLQPDRSPGLDVERVRDVINRIALDSGLVEQQSTNAGEDEGGWVNHFLETRNVRELWRLVRERLYEDEEIGHDVQRASIVVCSEANGAWDAYLLLHHFDTAEPLDSIDELER